MSHRSKKLLMRRVGRVFIPVLLILCSSSPLTAQLILSGQVVDAETRLPVVGANVQIVDSDEGTTTDSDGNFQIESAVQLPATIRISHIAYLQIELAVTGIDPINVMLEPATLPGQEVIVTGQRSRSDAELSSAVVLIATADIELSGISDLTEALAPLTSVRVEVSPFGKQTVNIRGSNANEVPIYLDGIKLNDAYSGEADISLIDMTDITEIVVVKGGSVALFGPGALGGAVSLSSRHPDKNRITFSRGLGITDPNDQDLSVSGDLRAGSVAIGGRYTGKSRLYNGRSLFTNLQSILSASVYPAGGELSAKLYRRGKFIEFENGLTAQSDSTTLMGLTYRGSILGSRNWDISIGQRSWSRNDQIVTSLERDLTDQNRLTRVSKSFSKSIVEVTLQGEYEEQLFEGVNRFKNKFGAITAIWDGNVTRLNKGYAAITKVRAPIDHPNIEHVKWEIAFRRDYTITQSEFEIGVPIYSENGQMSFSSIDSETDDQTRSQIIRLGFAFEGGGENFTYEFYVNQGSNQRLPNLRDIYLYQATPGYVRGDPLLPEYYTGTDLGIKLHRENPANKNILAWLETNLEFFTNSYLQKIAHRSILGSQLLPFNRQGAQIHGFEASLKFASPKQHYITSTGLQFITVSDPFVFPNKPLARFTFQIDANYSWGTVRIDNLWEGRQYIVLDSFLDIDAHDRKNTNISIVMGRQVGRVKGSLVINMRNLLNFKPVAADAEAYANIPYEYFEARRNLLSLRLEL